MSLGYPTRSEADSAWMELAHQIYADIPSLSDTAAREPATATGELTIIGSGIGVMGFTRDAEQYIDDADHVVFCVADPATQVWLRGRRPDAIDLFALYDDRKPRYHTYMQMTEAMLYHVRRGKRVAAVFYGHPGIFVLSTHRAVAIARREGHRAQLRPGVSALDWLCADLGIDPAYPGMQTFEATDMLLRRRAIDPGSHVVLWQVGLIAEMGFRRRGFHNRRFDYLVEYLRGYYKPDHKIVHYIASRYPTLPPVIERYTLDELQNPEVHALITGISTFYVPPAQARAVDVDFAREVGLIQPGQHVGKPRLSRPLDRYGPREMRAIAALKDFRPPADYHFQTDTAAARFLLALSEQPELRRRFEANPEHALAAFPGLSAEERKQLSSRRTARTQRAARGAAVSISPGEQFVIDLETKPAVANQWMQLLNTAVKASPKNWQPVEDWLSQNYQGLALADVSDAVSSTQAWLLLMWNGVYATSGNAPQALFVMAGAPGDGAATSTVTSGTVYLNASPLFKVSFSGGQLTFSQKDGNPCNGTLTFANPGASTPQSVSGMLWQDSQGKPSSNNFTATLQPLPSNPLSVWTGEYATVYTDNQQAGPGVAVFLPSTTNPSPTLYIGGQEVSGTSFANPTITWSGGQLSFALDANTTGALTLSGNIAGRAITGNTVASSATGFAGQYATQHVASVKGANVWQPFYPLGFTAPTSGSTTCTAWLGSQSFTAQFSNRQLTWSNGPSQIPNGQLSLSVNALTNAACFVGVTWANGDAKPTSPNIQGIASANSPANFVGNYNTTLDQQPAQVLSIGGDPNSIQVTYGSEKVTYSFFTGQLSGTTSSGLKLNAVFKYVTQGSHTPAQYVTAFTGTQTVNSAQHQWDSSQLSNDVQQWLGTYTTFLVDPGNGSLTAGGPTLTLSGTAASFTVQITADGTTTTLQNPKYQITGNTLYWSGENVSGGSNYNNGAISFYLDPRKQQRAFKGVFYANKPAPTAINWYGTPAGNNPSPPSPGFPWWGYLLIGLGIVGLGVGGLLLWRARASGYQRLATEDSIEMWEKKCQ